MKKADIYGSGDSERIIGAALRKYKIPRSKVVLLSKCYAGLPDDTDNLDESQMLQAMSVNDGVMVNRVGLSRKHIFDAVDASIARLGTYLDVLQIHRLDRETPREEIMKALNDVVESGKVRYIGACTVRLLTPPTQSITRFQRLTNILRWQHGSFNPSKISRSKTVGINLSACKITTA